MFDNNTHIEYWMYTLDLDFENMNQLYCVLADIETVLIDHHFVAMEHISRAGPRLVPNQWETA